MAKVSVLIPVYNAENYLAECLESLQAQTYSDFEVIMVDDGSTDHSGEICDDFAKRDGRFRVIHTGNNGSGSARNTAIEAAMESGADEGYIAWVDADDVVHPQYLELLVAYMERFPQYDIVQCDYTMNEAVLGKKHSEDVQSFNSGKDFLLSFKEKTDFSVLWNKLYRKRLYRNVRVRIDEKITGKIHNDVNLLWQLYSKSDGGIWFHHYLYFYRTVQGSIQHKKIASRRLELFELSRWMCTELGNADGFQDVVKYLSGKCLFDFAYLLRLPKQEYENYPTFYQEMKRTYRSLSRDMNLTAERLDLKLLSKAGGVCFLSFRLYGRLYYMIKK